VVHFAWPDITRARGSRHCAGGVFGVVDRGLGGNTGFIPEILDVAAGAGEGLVEPAGDALKRPASSLGLATFCAAATIVKAMTNTQTPRRAARDFADDRAMLVRCSSPPTDFQSPARQMVKCRLG